MDQQIGRRIRDDSGDLGRRQPPDHRHQHHAGARHAQCQFHRPVAVLADIGDALALLQPRDDGLRGLGLLAMTTIGPLRRIVMREGVLPRLGAPSLMR